jgi:hypothetical protein
MGPLTLKWYSDRGLLEEGDAEPAVYYSAGRIDIRGLDRTKCYEGRHEYGLAPMVSDDWYALSAWLDNLKTKELLPCDKLIERFEEYSGKKIRWYKKKKPIEQESDI